MVILFSNFFPRPSLYEILPSRRVLFIYFLPVLTILRTSIFVLLTLLHCYCYILSFFLECGILLLHPAAEQNPPSELRIISLSTIFLVVICWRFVRQVAESSHTRSLPIIAHYCCRSGRPRPFTKLRSQPSLHGRGRRTSASRLGFHRHE